MGKTIYYTRKLIPRLLFSTLQPVYHFTLALVGALLYRFPSRKIFVVGVTGTKGKTTVVELAGAILEEAGFTTALSNTLRFKVGNESHLNKLKMTMPGRFFMQKFLREAVSKQCQYAFIEMTSEGVKQFRHTFIDLDALIFTNLSPEHIESHGSYENYRDAKLQIAKVLEKSHKKQKFDGEEQDAKGSVLIVNKDDKESDKFLKTDVPHKYSFSISDAEPYELQKDGVQITFGGMRISSTLQGKFNIYNILAALTFAKSQYLGIDIAKSAIERFGGMPGRMESVHEGQSFTVIVDYAHTPLSLEEVYKTFTQSRKICVLGATGGGRDKWKRKEMGHIAGRYCREIILTNEDPYDESPLQIIADVRSGFTKLQIESHKIQVVVDRREAIKKALEIAGQDDIVLITGKGTDPYIMGSGGTKTEWSDKRIVEEELRKLLSKGV